MREIAHNITNLDIVWLAGLLEGEGCFCAAGSGKRAKTCPQIQLTMTDADIVERAASLMGANRVASRQPKHDNHKVQFSFTVGGSLAAAWMIMLYRFLGFRRRLACKTAILAWRTSRNLPRVYKGERLMATCHPTRKRWARGLCKGCYDSQRTNTPLPFERTSPAYSHQQAERSREVWRKRRIGLLPMPIVRSLGG